MKRLVFWQLFVAALLLTGNSHAQSIKDLFNKENIEKAVNAGQSEKPVAILAIIV